jgi:MFS family permease
MIALAGRQRHGVDALHVAALALGPLIDRFGARTMLLLTIGVVGAHSFLLAGTQQLWTNSIYVLFMLSA